jgi:hypothetical protein
LKWNNPPGLSLRARFHPWMPWFSSVCDQHYCH